MYRLPFGLRRNIRGTIHFIPTPKVLQRLETYSASTNALVLRTKYPQFFEVSTYTALFQTNGRKYSGCMDTGFGSEKPYTETARVFTYYQDIVYMMYKKKPFRSKTIGLSTKSKGQKCRGSKRLGLITCKDERRIAGIPATVERMRVPVPLINEQRQIKNAPSTARTPKNCSCNIEPGLFQIHANIFECSSS